MSSLVDDLHAALGGIDGLEIRRNVCLAHYTRFGLGGPAAILCQTGLREVLLEAWRLIRQSGVPAAILGGGTNVIAPDDGFPGVVIRFTGNGLRIADGQVLAEAGVELQDLVDATIEHGLQGLETLTRLPGWVGGAIYGNAGAYGRSISDFLTGVEFFDGTSVRHLDRVQCEFAYRESIFKRHRDWFILAAEFSFEPGDPQQLRDTASQIAAIRDLKFPPEMKCAGSIFKNLFLSDLPAELASSVPPEVVREGKVPAAWFLDQVGAKGLTVGGVRVSEHHANLIYNSSTGTTADLLRLIAELKARVRDRFGLELEEEVQYLRPV